MKFSQKPVPQNIDPTVRDWLIDLQQRVSDALNVLEPEKLILPVNNTAPTRRQSDSFEIIGADGTNWNPGGGAGVYLDNGSTYTKL